MAPSTSGADKTRKKKRKIYTISYELTAKNKVKQPIAREIFKPRKRSIAEIHREDEDIMLLLLALED